MGRLAVVVLTWNGREVALPCLESLRGEMGPTDAVFVVDNASKDGTADAVAEMHPWVRLVRNEENLGYAGGMNTGLARAADAGFDLLLVLNQDTVVEPGAIDALLRAARTHTDAASFQPLLVRLGQDGVIDSAGQRLHRVPGATDWLAGAPVSAAPAETCEIFGACGAAALYRTEALREVGLFDEQHFLIFEDVDLAFRLRLAGRRALLVPGARVLHRRGISGGAQSASALRRFLVARNSVAIALRYWPLGWLLVSSPVLGLRALRALSLRWKFGRACGRMWGRALEARGVARAAARRHGVDRWLTTRSAPL